MKSIYLIVLFSLYSFTVFGQTKFSKNQVVEDLRVLKKSLEDTHYNLYAYTTKKDFETTYNNVKNKIKKDSLNFLEVTNLFQEVVSKINNGHTRIPYPVQSYMEYAKSGGTIFPLEVVFENGKTLVRKNWSVNKTIKIGAELLSINGLKTEEVLEKIYPQISAERPYFKNAQIEFFTLPRYYWRVFGEVDKFEIKIRQNGGIENYSLKSIKAIDDFEMKREDIINYKRSFRFMPNVSYINPGNFGGNEDKYRRFIDSAFVEINAKQSKNLIIDLRNNPGGDDSFSDYLVSYIADKPFKWSSRFQLKTSKLLKEHVRQTKDTTKAFWKSVFQHKNGEIYSYDFGLYEPQPKSKRFKGNVYVLVNRQSYSQSTVTAAQIQDYNFGTIVGEETGEYANLYASIFSYELPQTSIKVDVSKGRIERVNGKNKDQGVIPEIKIKGHLLDEEDEILEELLKIIDKN